MRGSIVFMDGFDCVRDSETQSIQIFSTKLPQDLVEVLNRTSIPDEVVDEVVLLYNSKDLSTVDEYLLNEGKITQDEREIIVEGLAGFESMFTKTVTMKKVNKINDSNKFVVTDTEGSVIAIIGEADQIEGAVSQHFCGAQTEYKNHEFFKHSGYYSVTIEVNDDGDVNDYEFYLTETVDYSK